MTFRRVGTIIVLIFAAWIVWAVIRQHRMKEGFDRIAPGMSQEDVVKIMGRPSGISDCAGLTAHPAPDCVTAYLYASPWAPFNPEYPVVWFDKDRRVIDRYDYRSP